VAVRRSAPTRGAKFQVHKRNSTGDAAAAGVRCLLGARWHGARTGTGVLNYVPGLGRAIAATQSDAHDTDDNTDDARPKRDKREKTRADGIRVRIGPEPKGRCGNDEQQGTGAHDEERESYLDEPGSAVFAHRASSLLAPPNGSRFSCGRAVRRRCQGWTPMYDSERLPAPLALVTLRCIARSSAPHGDSKLPRATSAMMHLGSIHQGVNLPGLHVLLQLLVPRRRVEGCEPLAEGRQPSASSAR
jgi:hypothetical protein